MSRIKIVISELTAAVILVILEGLDLAVQLGLLLLVPAGEIGESSGALVGVGNESVGAIHGTEVLANGVDTFFLGVVPDSKFEKFCRKYKSYA